VRSRSRWIAWLAGAAVATMTGLGCGGDDAGSMSGAQCTASAQVPCTCPSGSQSTAVCGPSGVIGVCACGTVAGSSGGVAGAVSPLPPAGGSGTAAVPPATGVAGAPMTIGAAGAPAVAGAPAAMSGAAGMSVSAIAGAPATAGAAAPVGAAGAPAPAGGAGAAAASGCAPGEMCKPSALGGVKFCTTDPSAVLPSTCPGNGQACGTNGKGLCIDAASVGFAGMLFCIYTAC
jgi:hypothetical protein